VQMQKRFECLKGKIVKAAKKNARDKLCSSKNNRKTEIVEMQNKQR